MDLKSHLKEQPASERADFEQLVKTLKSWPEATVSGDFTDRVMDAVARESLAEKRFSPARSLKGYARPIAIAAGLLILAAGSLPFLRRDCPRQGEINPIDWLASVQGQDGLWDPAKYGGYASYCPALTSLSALALDKDPQNRYGEEIRRACLALGNLQNSHSGAFGTAERAGHYNHAMTTYALARLEPRCPEIKPVLEKAISFISESQSAAGGWDYVPDSDGNTAITIWNLRALAQADALGIRQAKIPLCKGLRWLRNAVMADGGIVCSKRGPENRSECLTALTAYAFLEATPNFPELGKLARMLLDRLPADVPLLDLRDSYRDYAKTIAFTAAGADRKAAISRGYLRNHPVEDLHKDMWGSVGGHLYTRALAALVQ